MDRHCFFVQTYRSKAERLVSDPAQFFADEASAQRAARRLVRFRAGVVIASQRLDPVTGRRERPAALAVLGRVPPAWALPREAA